MYTATIVVLLGIAVALINLGITSRRHSLTGLGAALAITTVAVFSLMSLWGEMLWFSALGYGQRFWTVILAKIGFTVLGAAIAGAIVYLITFGISRDKILIKLIACIVAAVYGANWGLIYWDVILRFLNRVSTELADPILNKSTGFYLFTLPFYDALFELLLFVTFISLVASVVAIFFRVSTSSVVIDLSAGFGRRPDKRHKAVYFNAALLVLAFAFGQFLERYHLMYSELGAVSGPGWTDVHVRLPALMLFVILAVVVAVLLVIAPFSKRMQRLTDVWEVGPAFSGFVVMGFFGVILFGVYIIGLGVLPGSFQYLRVEPNEITFEEPYIANNIEFTLHGFNLNKVEEKEFPASGEFTRQSVEANQDLFDNIRLWDWRALDAVFKQFQEIRLYYEFVDVDIDRYTIADRYRQVMVSAREMEMNNLPEQSQTFVNRRFKYTHGYGLCLTNVSEFTPQGLPNLLVRDIPPQSKYDSLKVEQPQIYYGELTDSHVVVNSDEEEFDYPRGETNVYMHYSGSGGVNIGSVWRKFLFGWKFDGTRFFFSGYPNADSRIMFHRQIRERVETLAPFLRFDDDPYIVLEDGKLYWIIDAYATSEYFPYSEPYSGYEDIEMTRGDRSGTYRYSVAGDMRGINYIRNSVKVVIDAFNGSVDFYIFEPDDPVIQVWRNIFPELFKPREEMPDNLQRHVRYPEDMLLIQSIVYAKYHMGDPTVFYNQEDLWIRATEKYYNRVQPVEPYYVMWEQPSSDDLEFVMIQPFTPKNRQVLIGWIAGMCDGENYGRLLAYKFPKEKRILGPQQVETKIDQESFLSGQLTLWDQRGSSVIRGNVLAIPVDETIIYVEPIYLQAETAAYPELRLVCVMHGDNLSYAESFDEALRGLFGEGEAPAEAISRQPIATDATVNELIRQANEAFEDYLQFTGEKEFEKASQSLDRLQQTLQQLSEQSTPAEPEAP